MKKIYLTKHLYAIVDNDDFDFLSKWKWQANRNKIGIYYARRTVFVKNKKFSVYMHRAILNLKNKKNEIDHINKNTLDNRKNNLRIVDHTINMLNTNWRRNFCGYTGVSKHRKNGYRARINLYNKEFSLGIYSSPQKAHQKYMQIKNKILSLYEPEVSSMA